MVRIHDPDLEAMKLQFEMEREAMATVRNLKSDEAAIALANILMEDKPYDDYDAKRRKAILAQIVNREIDIHLDESNQNLIDKIVSYTRNI